MDVPIGAIISFYGDLQAAEAQQVAGWWICDGQRIVDDPAALILKDQPTPDLRNRFLMGDPNNVAGSHGGDTTSRIPDQTIESHTTGGFGAPAIYSDPFTHMQGAHTYTTDNSIYSEGTFQGPDIPVIPPFMSVVWLIRVK